MKTSLIDARLSVYPRLLKLNGRLELMFSRMALRTAGPDPETEAPLLIPESTHVEQDSADEEMFMDDDFDAADEDYDEDEDDDDDDDDDDVSQPE